MNFPERHVVAPLTEKLYQKADMEKMLDYIDILNELDTSQVEPMTHIFPSMQFFLSDVLYT